MPIIDAQSDLTGFCRWRSLNGTNREADLLRGFQIDYQLELRRLLYWQVGGFRPFENLVHECSRAPVQVGYVRSIRH